MRGTYSEMTSLEARKINSPLDYLRIILTDEDDVPDAIAKLRTIYPNLLRLSYDNRRTQEMRDIDSDSLSEKDSMITPESVFAELYELQNNTPPNDRILHMVKQLFKETEAK